MADTSYDFNEFSQPVTGYGSEDMSTDARNDSFEGSTFSLSDNSADEARIRNIINSLREVQGNEETSDSEHGLSLAGKMESGILSEDISDVDSPESEPARYILPSDHDLFSDSEDNESVILPPELTETDFNYRNENPWTDEELLSFLLYDIKSGYNVHREPFEQFNKIIRLFSPLTPYSLKASLRHLEKVTGIQHIRYPCCINSCMAMTENTSSQKCLLCGESILGPDGKPKATFDYIPLTHQLKLQLANGNRAKLWYTYRKNCEESYEKTGVMTDIWNGKLVSEIRYASKSYISSNIFTTTNYYMIQIQRTSRPSY